MFQEQGFEIVKSIISAGECAEIEAELAKFKITGAGTRNLLETSWCTALAAKVRLHPTIARLVPQSHIAAQCTYFEKSKERNWLVSLHQDLSIPVAARIDHHSLSGWSEKEGGIYVQPPLSVLEEIVAVRIHIDPCGHDDGPLKVVPGTHTLGIIGPEAGLIARGKTQEVPCIAEQGSAVVMRPLILHASSKASGHSQRRVLHFVFGPKVLPYGLRWQTAA